MIKFACLLKRRICTLDVRDVGYIFEEMWHGKSVISGPDDKLCLTRWDRRKKLDYLNTVCMTRVEANAHDKLPENTDLEKHYGKEVYNRVEERFTQQRLRQATWGQVL